MFGIRKHPLNIHSIKQLIFAVDIIGLLLFFRIFFYFFRHPHADFNVWLVQIIFYVPMILVVYYIFDLYKPESEVSGLRPPGRAIFAAGVSLVILFTFSYLTQPMFFPFTFSSRKMVVYTLASFALWAAFWRLNIARWMRVRQKKIRWMGLCDLKIIDEVRRDFSQQKDLGTVDIFVKNHDRAEIDFERPVQGTWSDIPENAHKTYTGILIASYESFPDELLKKMIRFRLKGTRIFNLVNFYEYYCSKVPIYHLRSDWPVISDGFNIFHNPLSLRLKKTTDYFLATLLFLITLPLFPVIALCIRLESRGPIFFRQKRYGQDESIFTLYKFRTMYEGSERGDKYTTENDQRITKVGKILRKTRLDEFPQLFNILRGEMSLIGPRAEWTKCVEDYENVIPLYHLRHLVKPGITGWAQVLYPYGASVEDAKEKLQYDLYYIKNYSLLLDVAIIFKTFRTMIFGRGR